MKKITVACFVFLMIVSPAWADPPAAEKNEALFFSTIQDMPLMPGMQELDDQTLTFDKPEGRIVESVAAIQSGSRESVSAFYNDTLPQFGWMRIADNSFVRGDEELRMDFEAVDGQDFVRVMIAPRVPSPN